MAYRKTNKDLTNTRLDQQHVGEKQFASVLATLELRCNNYNLQSSNWTAFCSFYRQYTMHYNRSDICAAYWYFIDLPVGLVYASSKFQQLRRIRYTPGLCAGKLSELTPNAKQIYMQLVRKLYA